MSFLTCLGSAGPGAAADSGAEIGFSEYLTKNNYQRSECRAKLASTLPSAADKLRNSFRPPVWNTPPRWRGRDMAARSMANEKKPAWDADFRARIKLMIKA